MKNKININFVIFILTISAQAHAYKVVLYECENKSPTIKNCDKLCKKTDVTMSIEVNTQKQIVMTSFEKYGRKTPPEVIENCSVIREKLWSCKTQSSSMNFSITYTESFDGEMYFSSTSETSFLDGKIKFNDKNYCGLQLGLF